MKGKRILALLAVLFFACVFSAKAEDKFGVKVYDGAKFDAARSKGVSLLWSIDTACYHTSDSLEKVTKFYKNQPGMKDMSGSKETPIFRKGNVQVTIENPWYDTNGKKMTDTLITIQNLK